MVGFHAWRSIAGIVLGVWLAWTGCDQVKPPSVDREKAMLLYWALLNRASTQAAYKLPLWRSTAIEANIGCASTGWPVSGSGMMALGGFSWGSTSGCCTSAEIGADQVSPWSVDRSRVKVPGRLLVNM